MITLKYNTCENRALILSTTSEFKQAARLSVEFLDEPDAIVEEKIVAPTKKEVELPPIQVEGFV